MIIKKEKLHHPTGITIDKKDNIYVINSDKYRIYVFNRKGHFICKWGEKSQLRGPQNIVVDRFGYVFITDALNHCIHVFTSKGKFIYKWNRQELAINDNWLLTGIIVNNKKNLYLAHINQIIVYSY